MVTWCSPVTWLQVDDVNQLSQQIKVHTAHCTEYNDVMSSWHFYTLVWGPRDTRPVSLAWIRKSRLIITRLLPLCIWFRKGLYNGNCPYFFTDIRSAHAPATNDKLTSKYTDETHHSFSLRRVCACVCTSARACVCACASVCMSVPVCVEMRSG